MRLGFSCVKILFTMSNDNIADFNKKELVARRAFNHVLAGLPKHDREFYELFIDNIVQILASDHPKEVLNSELYRFRKLVDQAGMDDFTSFISNCYKTKERMVREMEAVPFEPAEVIHPDFTKPRKK